MNLANRIEFPFNGIGIKLKILAKTTAYDMVGHQVILLREYKIVLTPTVNISSTHVIIIYSFSILTLMLHTESYSFLHPTTCTIYRLEHRFRVFFSSCADRTI